MSTTINRAYSAFDNFEKATGHDAAAALKQLVVDLAATRGNVPAEDWKDCCTAISTHRAFDQLLQDPYTRDARGKPAGYAGDARTLDYVYLRKSGPQQTTHLGDTLFNISTGIAIADAVRARCVHIAQILMNELARRHSVSTASIACGHARELDLVPAATRSHLVFWGVDQDTQSVKACRERFESPQHDFQVGSVAEVLRGTRKIPHSNLIYASGLFDYLDDRVGGALVRRMCAALMPGGTMIIANLTKVNEEIAYMEAVMNWWMNYRDEAGVAALAEQARIDPLKHRISTYATSEGRVAWLAIERI